LNAGANTVSANGISTFSDWTAGSLLAPTASDVSVAGRVISASGRGVANAAVTFTDSQGAVYTTMSGQTGRFFKDGLPLNETYVVTVSAKRFRFAPQVLTLNSDLTGLNFTATP